MAKVDFWTAVSFRSQPKSYFQSALETVDSYFYFGGKKACVIPNVRENGSAVAEFAKHDSSHFLVTALKIISYFTVVIPVIMFVTKYALRSAYSLNIAYKALEEEFDSLNSNYLQTIRLVEGCGSRGQGYVDRAYESLKTFVQTNHPVFDGRLPKKTTVLDDGTGGLCSGIAAIWKCLPTKEDKETGPVIKIGH